MSQAVVRVEGLPELRKQLRQLETGTADLKEANAAVADFVAKHAATRAPRRTGALAASLRGNKAVGRATVRGGGARVPYAGPIHWGWPGHHIKANPFVVDAAQETEPQWLPIYEAALDKLVDRIQT